MGAEDLFFIPVLFLSKKLTIHSLYYFEDIKIQFLLILHQLHF